MLTEWSISNHFTEHVRLANIFYEKLLAFQTVPYLLQISDWRAAWLQIFIRPEFRRIYIAIG